MAIIEKKVALVGSKGREEVIIDPRVTKIRLLHAA